MLATSDIDRILMQLSAPRHGIVPASEAHAHGISPSAISRRISSGVARWVFPGILAVGPAAFELSEEALQHAALLHAGADSALSYDWAGRRQRIYDRGRTPIHVSCQRKVPRGEWHGVQFHERYTLTPQDVIVDDGLRWTSPTRTCFDLARGHTAYQVAHAIDNATVRRSFDERLYRRLLDANFRAPWSAVAREGLELFLSGSCGTRSEAEDRWIERWILAGYPMPFVNNRHALGIAGVESDFYFRDRGRIIEIDGAASHDKPFMREADQRRDELMRVRTIDTMRFAAIDMYRRPGWVIAESARFVGYL